MQNERIDAKEKNISQKLSLLWEKTVGEIRSTGNSSKNRFVNIILITGFCLGILFCIFIPYGAGFDEEQHMLRIYDLSGFNIMPNQEPGNKTIGFSEFFTLSYQRRYFQSSAIDLFNKENFLTKADYDSMAITKTRSDYSPIMFLPQAFMTGVIWRLLDIPIIPGVIVLRLTGFLIYFMMVCIAIRFIPVGKWILAILACSPTALFQAATVNADVFTNGVCFFFIGYVLHLVVGDEKVISSKELLLLICATLLLGFAKPTTSILVLFLFIIPKKKLGSTKNIFLIFAVAIITIICNVGWTVLVNESVKINNISSEVLNTDIDLMERIRLVMMTRPVEFVSLFFSGFFQSFIPRYQAWVGVYGYWVGTVPGVIYWLYPILILTAIYADSDSIKYNKKTVVWLIFTYLLCTLGLSSLRAGLRAVEILGGSDRSMLDSQGRYFVPYMPLFFIAIVSLIKTKIRDLFWLRWLSIVLFITISGLYAFGLFTTYYTDCGYEYFVGSNCRMPKYKNLEIRNAPVVTLYQDNSVKQSFINTCREIENVQIYIKATNSRNGSIQVSLINNDTAELLTSQLFDIENINNQSFLTLPYSGLVDKGSEYEIDLEANGLDKSTGVDLGIRPEEVYEGSLLIDDQLSEGDLIFFYTCRK
jgi:uncharacterized membrane protein